jgi:hypothetical protein
VDDPAVIRNVLRAHGWTMADRGRLSAEHREAYDAIMAAEAQDAYVSASEPPGPAAGDSEPDTPLGAERPPGRPGKGRSVVVQLRDRRRGGQGRAKAKAGQGRAAKAARQRLPADRLIGRAWGWASKAMEPLSLPAARCLAMQSPVAGMILEDALKGTVIDRLALQPLARGERRLETGAALLGPPAAVLGIEYAQGLKEPAKSLQTAFWLSVLEESLDMWLDIAGDKVEAAAERVAQSAERRATIQRMIGEIFAQTVPGETEPSADPAAEAARAEDAEAARAQAAAGVGH